MLVLQIFIQFIYMLVVPYLTAAIFMPELCKIIGRHSFVYLTAIGLSMQYAAFEVLEVFFQLRGGSFRRVSKIYLVFMCLCVCLGVLRILWWQQALRKQSKGALFWKYDVQKKQEIPETAIKNETVSASIDKVCFALGIVLIIIQIVVILIMATPDKDDAFYSGLSAMSIAQDRLLSINAYDGLMENTISNRYIMSALPIYQASLSYLGLGLHYLFIIHNLFPLFYMPFGYGLLFCLGSELLGEQGIYAKGKLLLVLALLHMIGNYFVFSPENFLVTRIWQGKAIFVAIGIPILWKMSERAFAVLGQKQEYSLWEKCIAWLMVAAIMLACTFLGETGLYLAPFMLGAMSISALWVWRKWKGVPLAILSCVPELLLFWIYLA